MISLTKEIFYESEKNGTLRNSPETLHCKAKF